MKLLYLAFFIICSPASAQNRDTAKLVLRTGGCRPMPYFNPTTPDSVLFFLQSDNKLIAKVLMRQQRRFPVDLAIPKGNYRIVYPNIYGEMVDKKYALYNDTAIELRLCPDSLMAYPENTLSKLTNKDRLIVDYHSIGCFNNNIEKLTITRIKGQLTARLYEQKKHILLKAKILSGKDILAFVAFENELRKAHKAGCTTQDYYSVRSKYWSCEIQDGSCSWGGFYTLKTFLFGESPK